ncbi:MAG: EAL domain-containing protein [Methylotetracoccus sp.]
MTGEEKITPDDQSRRRRVSSGEGADHEAITAEGTPAPQVSQLSQLQAELERTKDELRLAIENLEYSTAHLGDSNEEINALSRELRCATERLGASRDRLRTANQHLARLDRKHRDDIAELHRANGELRDLMAATNIGTLLIDGELRIKHVTPRVAELVPIGAGDLGCAIGCLADRLNYPGLTEDCEAVLHTLKTREAELEFSDGRRVLARSLPYRSLDDRVDGVVLTLHVIAERGHDDADRVKSNERAHITLTSIGEGVIITDPGGRVEWINPRAESLTGSSNADSRGLPWQHVAPIRREDNGQPLPDAVQQCLSRQEIIEPGTAAMMIRPDGTEIPLEFSIAPIRGPAGQNLGAVIALRDISEHRRLIRQISYQATHDALTGLINRQEFERRLSLMLKRAHELGRQHALCFLDLDQFKVINDTFGHVAGDALLRQLSGLLQVQVRRERDTLARIGGDEFGLLLGECALDRAIRVAENLRDSIQKFCFMWENRPFRIGVSIGVTPISGETPDLSSVLSAADTACYMAKDRGRNRVEVYRPDAVEIVQRRCEMRWAYRLQQALSEGRFHLHYQPIVPISPERDEGLHGEVLLRMLDEEGQVLLPSAFIPAAERYEQMVALDRWVIGTAISLLCELDTGSPEHVCSINLSAQSLGNSELLQFIVAQLDETGLSPRRVCFEVTETAAIANLPAALEFMTHLRAKGCRFALDDFGTGLSSFGYLKNLPVDYLKIDGSFMRHIADDPIDRAMVETINRVGHLMGMKTIAECVESADMLETLKGLGVDYVQGYCISDVQPFERYLK